MTFFTWKTPIAVVSALLTSILSLSAQEPTAPPTVIVESVVKVSESNPKRYVGTVEAIRQTDIMPRVSGNLLKIHFQEGEIIQAGTLLYELEDTAFRAAVDGLKAQREAALAAIVYSEKEYKRNKTLWSSKAVSESSYERTTFDIQSARAKVKQLEAALVDAENTLSYTRIHAPITGRIGKSVYTEGNLITPSGGKLADISMIAPIYVRFSISEKVFRKEFGGLAEIKNKAIVRIRLADGTVYHETASIALIDNKINVSSNTITLWAVFPNKDHQLIPGSFVNVMLSAKNDKKWNAVSPSALIYGHDGISVYTVDAENKVVPRKIRVGALFDGKQIILEGLNGAERIITEGSNKVRPGMAVTPLTADQIKQ